ncbi:unnamed protein product [Ectocarpus sp. 6 AP-2014]
MRRYVPGIHVRGRSPSAEGLLDGDGARKGHAPKAGGASTKPISVSAGAAVAISLVAFTTVALKIHKYVVVGGSWSSSGAAAVIAEDMALFVAVFGLWYMTKSVQLGVARVWPLAVTRLLWGAMVGLTLVALAFLGIEHLYFCSTGSLLDPDIIKVVKKSLGPIIFIALQIEGKRGKRMAFFGTGFLAAGGAVVYKIRHGIPPRPAGGGSLHMRRLRKGLSRCLRAVWKRAARFMPSRVVLMTPCPAKVVALPKVPAAVAAFSTFVFVSAGLGPGLFGSDSDHSRVKLLRRNCFVGIALGMRSTPWATSSEHWASSVLAAVSPRIVGGIDVDANKPEGAPTSAGNRGDAASARGETSKRPNVVVVVLESTTGTMVTGSNNEGVSPWAKELASRGLSSSKFYSSMPNTNKAMFQVMCGMTPSLETAWVEFDRPDVLKAVCLPGLLRSKLGYQSLLLTGSMVGGLGVFGHDDAVGFAGEKEQGGRAGFKSRKVNDKARAFSFKHGAFEKVNYLGYDDHVVLNRSISFLLGEGQAQEDGRLGHNGGEAGGKLLTILTVGPHHHHDVPSDFLPQEFGPWEQASDTSSLQYKYRVALRYQDLFLERLFKQLDDTGLSDNTYVVVVGDHGEAFNEHGFDKHGNNVYQEGVIVPFFLTAPPGDAKIIPGQTLHRVGMQADIAPTLLDLLGLWNPQAMLPSRLQEANPSEEDEARSGDSSSHPQGLRGHTEVSNRKRGGGSTPDARPGGEREREFSAVGSGLIGDSLLGPEFRRCAVSSTHFGKKALAVVAGDWKGLFAYDLKKRDNQTHVEVLHAQLFALSLDPRETENLNEIAGSGSCCPIDDKASLSSPYAPREETMSASCDKAARYTAQVVLHGDGKEDAAEVCCLLETAAVAFVKNNLAFFGRQ